MSFPLHPSHLAIMYECLRKLPPFKEWKLPDADEIEFRTPAIIDFGEFRAPNVITVSSARHANFDTIMQTLAHEMLHLHQHLTGTENRYQHNAEFKRLAKRVTKNFGWDSKAF